MTRLAACVLALSLAGCAGRQAPENLEAERYAPPPPSILTPDQLETRIGTLRFFDGLPDPKTAETTYEHLDFMRAVRAFLQTLPAASMMAIRRGMDDAGALPNYTVLLTEQMMDSRSLFLTANSETVYALAWISLKGGPIVVETPPKVLGVFNDAWQRHLGDTGKTGPDRVRGGRYVVVPPAYEGYVPRSDFAVESPTHGVWAVFRGFPTKGSSKTAIKNFKKYLKIYPLKESARPPPNQFLDISGRAFSTIPANDFSYFEDIHELIQQEPNESQGPELLGLLASIGIEKDKPFTPDARMKEILRDAAEVGNATARALVFAPRDEEAKLFPDRQWKTPLIGGDADLPRSGTHLSDARLLLHYYASAITPATFSTKRGSGSQHAAAFRDSEGRPLDGSRTYRLTLPAQVPAAYFWSLTLYDNQTRSMLQTDQRFPSVSTSRSRVRPNPDGSITLELGPKPPRDRKKRANWIQTVPGGGWNAILRLYGPQQAWLDRTWSPSDFEMVSEIAAVRPSKKPPRMRTEVPNSVLTPDRVETRVGTLEFVHGVPTDETVRLLYDNLDFIRGVDTFLRTLSGASLVAMRRGLREAGVGANNVIGVFDRTLDSHSLFLTADTESIYLGTWLDLRDGAVVVESPANSLGILDDFFLRHVADLAIVRPDDGRSGLFLFVPPKYQGQISERYQAYKSRTYGNLLMWRAFPVEGDPTPTVEQIRNTLKVYPLDFEIDEEDALQMDEEETRFVSLSGEPLNTIHSSDLGFYEEIDELVQEEPHEALGPELTGLLASIGIERGARFAPDARMRAILTDAARVGNATARAIAFRSRDATAYRYEGSGWYTPFLGNSHRFQRKGVRLLDARTMFFYLATMTSPAMLVTKLGVGFQYSLAATDSLGGYLDGAQNYQLTLPKGIPAKDFWSIVVYDPQTRSMLQTPRTATPSLSNQHGAPVANEDGSTTIFFGPEAPEGRERNWIQTVPGKGWFAILRMYGPLLPWFDKSWRPGEIERR